MREALDSVHKSQRDISHLIITASAATLELIAQRLAVAALANIIVSSTWRIQKTFETKIKEKRLMSVVTTPMV